jgi:ankyrin repeat protein
VIVVFFVHGNSYAKDDWGSAEDWGGAEDWESGDDQQIPDDSGVSQDLTVHGKTGRAFIQHFDKDKDGRVSEAEFPGRDMGLKRFDTNNDGYIDATEAPTSPPAKDTRDTGFVQKYDKDNDGKVSLKEFPGEHVGFKKYDANKDGYLDQTEAPEAPPPDRKKGDEAVAKKPGRDKDRKVPKRKFPKVDVSFAGHGTKKEGCIIGEENIVEDIIGKTVEGWTFEAGAPCRIKILDTKLRNRTADMCIAFKAVSHTQRRRGWLGKQGKLLLKYQQDANDWKLTGIKADVLSELAKDDIYAVRKTAGHPLLVAVDEGDVETVRTLLDRGGNANERGMRGETALMMAAARGHVDVAGLLLKNGTDINGTCSAGMTALMSAANARQAEMVKFLSDKGAAPNRKGPLGHTALLLAVEGRPGQPAMPDMDLVSVVTALVKKGANVNARDERGFTVLWFALKEGNEDVIRVLLDNGAKVNTAGCKEGLTPLMQAVQMCCPSVVKLLLEKGSDVNAKKGDITPLTLAKARKSMELIHLLKNAGARE